MPNHTRLLPPTALRRATAALLALLLSGSAVAGPLRDALAQRRAERQADAAPDADDGDRRAEQLPAGSRVERDLAYGPDPQQHLDVYRPAQAQSAPIVLMVHGGAWMIGDKAMSRVVEHKAARWLPQGLILVSINYRLSRTAPQVMEQADDVARALSWVQQHAADWGGDAGKVLLMGHSAGAHLVTLLAAEPALATARGAKPWRGTVALDSAAYDLVSLMSAPHPRFYDTVFGSDRRLWEQASPRHRLGGVPAAPMLLVCSSRRADACAQARALAARGGRGIEVLPQDLSHGDINGRLGLPGDYTARVEAFMKTVGVL